MRTKAFAKTHSDSISQGTPIDVGLEFQFECAEFFGEVVQHFRLPKSTGQIYGLLYASPRPLSFSDVVVRLEISKGSASQGIHLLRTLGAIAVLEGDFEAPDETSKMGSRNTCARRARPRCSTAINDSRSIRRDYYKPELSLRKLVSEVLQRSVTSLGAKSVIKIARLRDSITPYGENRDFFLARVRRLEKWRKRIKTVIPLLKILLGPTGEK